MYTSFFGLTEKPFTITPDPRYLYLSERHAEALAHLLYGIEDAGGFVQLTGEVGTGKTTVVRSLLGQLPAHADVALILNPRMTPEEFLLAIADELNLVIPISLHHSVKSLVDQLNIFLLDAHARGRRVIVLVDEAQQLSADVLEQVRLLTNLETATQKLLQIILVGQPELRTLLARSELRQLAQRITGRYHLDPLVQCESLAYIRHRLRVAGATNDIFTPRALRELHRLSMGVPRLLNVIADRALLGAYTREVHTVTAALVRRAASEVHGRTITAPWLVFTLAATAAVGISVLGIAIYWLVIGHPARPHIAAVPATQVVLVQPKRAAVPATTLTFLSTHPGSASTDVALTTLFALWKLPIDSGQGRACEQATAAGLACLSQKGSLAQLRQLNRPVIVSLLTPNGEFQAVLAHLSDTKATLQIADDTLDVSIADFEQWWFGEFLLVWKPPTKTGTVLRPGMHGDAIRWLRTTVASINGTQAKSSTTYGADLQQEIAEFQKSHQLVVDGIAGAQTLLLLDSLASAPGTPTLHSSGA
jgi:general secretion pathway protein A